MSALPPKVNDSKSSGAQSPSAVPVGRTIKVKEQFEIWTSEKNRLEQETNDINRKCLSLKETTGNLCASRQDLTNRTFAAKDAAGLVESQIKSLEQQKERLENQLRLERQELEQCARDVEQLMATSTNENCDFIHAMKKINDELDSLLKKQGDVRLKNMIEMETVGLITDSSRFNSAPDNQSVMLDINDSISLLKDSEATYLDAKTRNDEMIERLQKLRALANKVTISSVLTHDDGQHLTDNTLDALEQKWLNRHSPDFMDQVPASDEAPVEQTLAMDLFYMNQSQESCVTD